MNQSDLFEAVISGDLDLVIECVQAGCDVKKVAANGYTPLCTAIRNGEVDVACFLIPHAGVLLKSEQLTPRHSMTLWCLLRTGRAQLLVNGGIADKALDSLTAAFQFAVSYSILNYLLARFDSQVMATLHINNYTVYSVLRTQLFQLYIARFVRYVFPSTTDQQCRTKAPGLRGTNLTREGSYAFELILRYGGNIEPIALRLLAHGLMFDDVNDLRGPAFSMWRWAALRGHREVVIALQELGMDINIGSNIALSIACQNLDRRLSEHLVMSGAATTLRLDGQNPPLVECAIGVRDVRQRNLLHESNALSIIEILLSNNAEINQPGHRGRTALSICCTFSELKQQARCLLDHAADTEIADQDGNTPLHHASAVCSLPLVKMLVAYGASSSHRDKNGKLPANKAARDGCSVETLRILLKASTTTTTQLDRDTMLFEA
ncbi:MAG: hypothetical protein Q9169_007907, partial [Polycauliona sp. 2 TL-2023]